MKISFIISGFIIAIAAWLNWHFDVRLAAAHSDQMNLAAKAAQSGISVEANRLDQSTARHRTDHVPDAHQLAREYIRLCQQSPNGKPDEATQAGFRDCEAKFQELNAKGWKIMIEEMLAAQAIDQKRRILIARYWLSQFLSKKNPGAALDFVKDHADAFRDEEGVAGVISISLGELANNDPLSAVEWMKKNAAEFPEAMKVQSLHNVIHSAARKDPGLAFTLISELGLSASDSHSPLHTIVTSAKTDDERNATLAALRNYRDTHKDNREITRTANQMFGYFSWGFKESGIRAASKWISEAKLSPKELEAFCDELSRNYDGDEHVEWIEWMGAALPADLGKSPIMDMIGRWAYQDYEVAGKWLASAPESPAKIAAIRGYVYHIFKHDLETAMQWAMTLPPGQDRDDTLKTIYMNWSKDDPAGKAAFAKEHGIK